METISGLAAGVDVGAAMGISGGEGSGVTRVVCEGVGVGINSTIVAWRLGVVRRVHKIAPIANERTAATKIPMISV